MVTRITDFEDLNHQPLDKIPGLVGSIPSCGGINASCCRSSSPDDLESVLQFSMFAFKFRNSEDQEYVLSNIELLQLFILNGKKMACNVE